MSIFKNIVKNDQPEETLFFPMMVTLYELSGKEVKEKLLSPDFNEEEFENFFPKYVVDGEDITETEYFFDIGFQDTDEDNDTLYLMFDVEYAHPLLEYEFQHTGFQDFFQYNQNSLPQLLRSLPKHTSDAHMKRGWQSFPNPIIIIVYMKYYTSYDYYSGGYEGDMDVWIEGYMDKNNNFIKYDDVFKDTGEQYPT